jgi:PAS domain S-box-containing protein
VTGPPSRAPSGTPPPPPGRGAPLRVLVVEDEPAHAELMIAELRRAGFVVEWSRVDTETAYLEQLARSPDLILSDYALPRFGGERALELLQDYWREIPFIAVSGTIGEEAAVSMMRRGAADYLLKDRLARLGPAVERALSARRLRGQQRESERRYRDFVTNVPMGLYRTTAAGEILDANPAMVQILGFPDRETLLATNMTSLYVNPGLRPARVALLERSAGTHEFVDQLRRHDGNPIWVRFRAQTIRDASGAVVCFEGALLDITDEKRATDLLRASEERFRGLFEQVPIGLYRTTPDGRVVDANAALLEMLGYQRKAIVAANAGDWYVDQDDRGRWLAQIERTGVVLGHEARMRRRDGGIIWTRDTARAARDDGGATRYYDGAIEDITARKDAEQAVKRQLNRLASLRTIDLAITASLDPRVTFSVLLDQVATQLGADAAAILLSDAETGTLTRTAARGLPSRPLRTDGTAGPAAQGLVDGAVAESRIVAVGDAATDPAARADEPALRGLGFAAYFAAPLVAKGQVKGVLEVLRRQPFFPDTEWLEFLEALAGQAAIAIDNAVLFGDLQRSNTELVRAYDTTLEGWGRALDLRDKQTEGHTQRVTDSTVKLARAMGVGGAELVHLRRGALLHDVGKIGIPDSILLKPGPLTDDEWMVMRRHPDYADKLLMPIEYLRPARAIPYCHHEKWDGTGYPRGLRGEEIPLAARIFAVVDVWDGLRSDRPYRRAWPIERVREHIRAQAGLHFDPAIVDVALRVLDEESG